MEEKQRIEELRNELNLEIRSVLAIMDMIDLANNPHDDYVKDSLNEEEYLKKQLELVEELKTRLVNVFKN